MCYAHAKVAEYAEQLAYRAYVTDSLRLSAQSKYITTRWVEQINKPNDNRTGDEIALDVISNAGLKFGE